MNKLLIISTLIVFTSCGQSTKPDNSNQTNQITDLPAAIETTTNDLKTKKQETSGRFDCTAFEFNSEEEQADSILTFLGNATDSSSTNRQKWEQKFFCAFPNSFKGMQSIFGYDDENGTAPLYSTENETYSYTDRHIMSDVIGFFSELKSIPDKAYYEKYIRINIDGYWEADNIRKSFGFHHRLISDTEAACKTLANFTDEEIRSVFRFIFDGPHPKNQHNEEIYKSLKPLAEQQNERLGNLLYEAYTTMTAEENDHGH